MFGGCSGLTSVTIPNSVTTIGKHAFDGCDLESVISLIEEPFAITGKNDNYRTFGLNTFNNATLYVPAGTIDKYKATDGWKDFAHIQSLESNETDYRPLAKEGKVWNYQRILYTNPWTYQNYSYIIKGDTTINDKEYKKLYYRSSRFETYAGALRDENGKAYYVQLDSVQEKLYYDLTVQGGDRIINPNTVYEYDSNTAFDIAGNNIVEVNGIPVHHVNWTWIDLIGGVTTHAYRHWYEGIGTIEDKFLPKKFQQSAHDFLSCIEDGVFIYGNKNSVPPNHYRRPIRFDYEAKDGLNHPKSKIWAENDNTSTGFYFQNLTDSFTIFVNNQFFAKVIGSTFMEWGGTFARFPISITIESDYEKFSGQIAERYEETDYRPFIEEGKVWKVGDFGAYPEGYTHAHIIEYFYFDGDTIVSGQPCKKMMCRKEIESYNEPQTTYIGALYEDVRRVYCALPNSNDFVLLYDFATPEETEIEYYHTYAKTNTRGYIRRRSLCEDSVYHGMITTVNLSLVNNPEAPYIDLPEVSVYWREGVGYNGFYNSEDIEAIGGFNQIMLCTVGDEVLYYDPSLIDCVTPDDSEVKKNTIDFTHIVKSQPKAPRREESTESADEETLTGEYSLKELFVNFKPLAGPYVITICNESGTEVYRKEVQTNNVIALNTDISDYPKGEYTITVENNEEAYTANFSIDDAVGIRRPTPDPSRDGGETAGAVYDLSGRKIHRTLPRGIYIRDGKKVVVR